MCCRYFYEDGLLDELYKIVDEIDRNLSVNGHRDIHPSDPALVIAGRQQELYAADMRWGFWNYDRKRLLINARQETALDKVSFRESALKRRCVIPASGFYEWDKSRQKVTFTDPDAQALYMAGFYQKYEEEWRFIIVTTEANVSMRPVHDRMPLLLTREQISGWIFQDDRIGAYLEQMPQELKRQQEYEQLSFF